MPIPNINREKIEQALHKFDRQQRGEWVGWELNRQHKYALLWQGKRYPIKEVIRLAAGTDDFFGGPEANNYLTKRGFEIIALDSIRKTDEILSSLLQEIQQKKGLNDLVEAANFLLYEAKNEIEGRATFFTELNDLLRRQPFDFLDLKLVILQKNNDILRGHISLQAQLNAFFKPETASRTEELIRNFIGDLAQIPEASQIDSFVDEAASLAFHDPQNHPKKDNAALFASVLLTAIFPNDFVDFRQNRWSEFAKNFALETAPADARYGELLRWGGRVAQQFAILTCIMK